MVIGSYIRCDMCDAVFKFRLQLDNSIYLYELPIGIMCPRCGNTFDCRYSNKNGILPMQYNVEIEDEADYSIAYSPQLPIPVGQYYQEKEMIGLTPYLELSQYYGMMGISGFGRYVQSILDDFYPQRELFLNCLPILKKGNVRTFQKMVQKLTGVNNSSKNIKDIEECFATYHNFYVSAWCTFAVKSYQEHAGKVFQKMLDAVQTMPKERLRDLYEKLDGLQSLSKWRWETWEDFGYWTEHVERYFPAMFYLYMGDYRLPHTPQFCIVTITQTYSNSNYSKAYTRLSQVLPLLIGLLNWENTGDYNVFPNRDGLMKGITDICSFASLAEGMRIEKLADYEEVQTYLMECLDSRMRNAIDHHHVEMDTESQVLKYFYRPVNGNLYKTGTLIDECYMTYICQLHLVEAVLIVDEIKNRLK